MATTVFPVTDQTATVALWSAMQSAIDRGAEDPLASIDSGSSDTARLQYAASTSGIKSDNTYTTLLSCQIDQGQVFLFEAFLAVSDATTASPADDLNYRLSVDSGIKAHGVYFGKAGGLTAAAANTFPISTTSTQVLFGRAAVNPTQTITSEFRFVAIGDTGGGEVKIEWAKAANSYANTFDVAYCYLIGRRIW